MISAYLSHMSQPAIISVALISIVISVFSLTVAIISVTASSKLKRRYRVLVKGQEGANLQALLVQNHSQVHEVEERLHDLQKLLENHESRLQQKTVTAQIHRYNAFAETGNDLSFSVSLVNEQGNGAVLSSIFGREESRVYAKPVMNGESKYTLTPEEKRVIQDALEMKRQ